MTNHSPFTLRLRMAIAKFLAIVARPARRAQGRGGIVIEAYRGYGTREEIFLIGRVFRQSHPDHETSADDVRASLRDIARRIRRRKVAGVIVTARCCDGEARTATDRDGYFRIHLQPHAVPAGDHAWHSVELTLNVVPPVRAQGQVYISPEGCRFVVISDIDDTIMRTGVANKFKMLWRLFVADAESRVAFPGAAALCRALHAGAGGSEGNPMLYVSRAPWGIYDMLAAFFRQHEIPVGPVLMLRDWGLSWRHPLPRKAEDHKREVIGNMLSLYRHLPFVLVGDSGQHDPEVYAQIVADHPGRVLAVYIRNISHSAKRINEIERLAVSVAAAGSSLVLAADSTTMAEHAILFGLIASETRGAVSAEQVASGDAKALTSGHRAAGSRAAAALRNVTDVELKGLLAEAPHTLPDVVVEAADRGRPNADSDLR